MVDVPDDVLDDLRDRLRRTRYPNALDGDGWGSGTDLGYLRELVARKTSGAEKATLSETDMTFHESEFGRLGAALEEAGTGTNLPDAPTARPRLHDLLLRVRRG